MNISDYITRLEKIKEHMGDLEVETCTVGGRRAIANNPTVKRRMILKGKEITPRFALESDEKDRWGDLVCKV